MGKRQNARKRNQGKAKRKKKPAPSKAKYLRAADASDKDIERVMRLQRYLAEEAKLTGIEEQSEIDEWITEQLASRDLGELLIESEKAPEIGVDADVLVQEALTSDDSEFRIRLLKKAVADDPEHSDALILLIMEETQPTGLRKLEAPIERFVAAASERGDQASVLGMHIILGTAFFLADGDSRGRSFADALRWFSAGKTLASEHWTLDNQLIFAAATFASGDRESGHALVTEIEDDGSATWAFLQVLSEYHGGDSGALVRATTRFPDAGKVVICGAGDDDIDAEANFIAMVFENTPGMPAFEDADED